MELGQSVGRHRRPVVVRIRQVGVSTSSRRQPSISQSNSTRGTCSATPTPAWHGCRRLRLLAAAAATAVRRRWRRADGGLEERWRRPADVGGGLRVVRSGDHPPAGRQPHGQVSRAAATSGGGRCAQRQARRHDRLTRHSPRH